MYVGCCARYGWLAVSGFLRGVGKPAASRERRGRRFLRYSCASVSVLWTRCRYFLNCCCVWWLVFFPGARLPPEANHAPLLCVRWCRRSMASHEPRVSLWWIFCSVSRFFSRALPRTNVMGCVRRWPWRSPPLLWWRRSCNRCHGRGDDGS